MLGVVVDEAGLISVEQANALVDVVVETGAAVRLVGDPRQLGYATDCASQGVTVDAWVTWVSDATTAAGLYVGAGRGRYGNILHVVAADEGEARRRLVVAMVRDRADRGLDAARARLKHAHSPPTLRLPRESGHTVMQFVGCRPRLARSGWG